MPSNNPAAFQEQVHESVRDNMLNKVQIFFTSTTENLRLLAGETVEAIETVVDELGTWKKIQVWIFYCFPILDQLQPSKYSWSFFLHDFLSALSVTAMIIPQSLAYGSLARVPPIQSFISATFPLLTYGVFGSGRQLAIGPEALTCVLLGVYSQKEVSAYGGNVSDIASTLTLLIAIFCLILTILQAGFIDNILAGYLLTGFVSGIGRESCSYQNNHVKGALIMTEQVPGLLGMRVETDSNASAIEILYAIFQNLESISPITFVIALSNVSFLFAAKKLKYIYGPMLKKKPGLKYLILIPELFVLVVFMTGLSVMLDLNSNGIKTLGDLGTLSFSVPSFQFDRVRRLLQPAITITIMGFVVTQVVNRTFGMQNNYTVSKHRELFALSTANFVSSVTGGHIVCGSLPRSQVLAGSGGRTMLCNFMVGIFAFAAIVLLGPLLSFLPKATLASAVFVAAYSLIDWHAIAFLFKLRNISEIAQFLATFAITIGSSISDGVVFCFLLAALVIVRKTTKLEMKIMGRVAVYQNQSLASPVTKEVLLNNITNSKFRDMNQPFNSFSEKLSVQYRFVSLDEYSDAHLFENVVIIAIKGSLAFYNANRIPREIDFAVHIQKKIGIQRRRAAKLQTQRIDAHQRVDTELRFVATTLATLEVVTGQKMSTKESPNIVGHSDESENSEIFMKMSSSTNELDQKPPKNETHPVLPSTTVIFDFSTCD
ncbi:Solute carrier 26, partial [Nowakowskiella sp. JEL0078]